VDLILKLKSNINVSINGWKAPNKDEYIATCTHFIDKDYKLQHILLSLSQLEGPKTGENISLVIKDVVKTYEFGHKLSAFMMDNAKDNDSTLKKLSTVFPIDTKRA
jgi:hypothetical protein